MARFFVITAAACCVALGAVASTAAAAPRMWVGFLDDQTFRWAPDRDAGWNEAKHVHTSVVRTVVRWDQIARWRPANRLNPFDPAYNFKDLDDFVIHAQQRGIEVLLTLWGTPAWANNDAGARVPPTDTADFAAFAHVVAARYSGTYPGLPYARFFSIWNEPNSPDVPERARPARTAYAALAEPATRRSRPPARRRPSRSARPQRRTIPGTFVDALAAADPTLRFDAWAHHPYPARPTGSPDTPRVPGRTPACSSSGVSTGDRVQRSAGRTSRCGSPSTASPAHTCAGTSGSDLARAVDDRRRRAERADVHLADAAQPPGTPWQSGIAQKPATARVRLDAAKYDARNPVVRSAASAVRSCFVVPGARAALASRAPERTSACGTASRSAGVASRAGCSPCA